jgi:ADP-ribose pyrophosphatase YjhB (NUDIX family)
MDEERAGQRATKRKIKPAANPSTILSAPFPTRFDRSLHIAYNRSRQTNRLSSPKQRTKASIMKSGEPASAAAPVPPAQQLALWADRLRGLSALGIHYASSDYERDRWRQVQSLVIEMLAQAMGDLPETLEPLRATLLSHPTPLAVGDAAIIDVEGRMLLIQRADNGLWAMPGGAFEVGETPAEGAVREALEETGVHSRPVALVGVFDSRFCGSVSRHHLYQFVFLCEPAADTPMDEASHGHEVKQVAWFTEAELPTELDPGHRTRIPLAFQVWRGERAAYFDPLTPSLAQSTSALRATEG